MNQRSPRMHSFDIEGERVSCHESNGRRLWRCGCADFEQRLTQYGEGFCAHTAAAIMRHLTTEGELADPPPQGVS